MDLWRMPVFEITHHREMQRTIDYIRDSVLSLKGHLPLLAGYLEVAEYDLIGGMKLLPPIVQKLEDFLERHE